MYAIRSIHGTRSSAMQSTTYTTLQLYRHIHFKDVIFFALDERGQPSCSISPSSRRRGTVALPTPFKQANGNILDYEGTAEYLAFCASPSSATQTHGKARPGVAAARERYGGEVWGLASFHYEWSSGFGLYAWKQQTH